ncbi:tail sheath protein [Yersinia entomophaga]|uniref:Tail sheath protein n=1 Tax=Yersinia entomophaga TaxID=935293 RepID=A0ABM6BPZ0_YERET|nr:tail sheath protein [Yersinia entomophaga]
MYWPPPGKTRKKDTLAPSLLAIAEQTKLVNIVVRVTTGNDAAEITPNIIGRSDENGRYTGMKALLAAQIVTGVRPRIPGVPRLDNLEIATALATICPQ